MAERYNFRLTRKTSWLADVIDSVPKKDQSDFIREMLIRGIHSNSPNQKLTDMSYKSQPNVRQTSDMSKVEFEFETIAPPQEDIDLDIKLNRMFA